MTSGHGPDAVPADLAPRPDKEPGAAESLLSAPRTGRWVRLMPVEAHHVDFLYNLTVDETVGYRWRYAGAVPSRETFVQSLWTNVRAQFVVVDRLQGRMLGHVILYNVDHHYGFGYIGGIMIPEANGTGLGIEAFDLFFGYCFATFNLRKIYMEVPEYNLPWMAMNRWEWAMREEGRLREHSYYAGRFWDWVILAVYREEYAAVPRTKFGRRRRRRPASGSPEP